MKKKWQDVVKTKEDYDKLVSTGYGWEFHPSLPLSWGDCLKQMEEKNLKKVFDASVYPKDEQFIVYYFEPFNRWYVGKFYLNKEDEITGPFVSGRHGFTTWHPEVTKWMEGEE